MKWIWPILTLIGAFVIWTADDLFLLRLFGCLLCIDAFLGEARLAISSKDHP